MSAPEVTAAHPVNRFGLLLFALVALLGFPVGSETLGRDAAPCDNCPAGADADADGFPNHLDNCPNVKNPDQADTDLDGDGQGEGIGDACRAILPAIRKEDGYILPGILVRSDNPNNRSIRIGDTERNRHLISILSFATANRKTGIPKGMVVESAALWLRRGSDRRENPFDWPGAHAWIDIKKGHFGSHKFLHPHDEGAAADHERVAEVMYTKPESGFVKTTLSDEALDSIERGTQVQLRFYLEPATNMNSQNDQNGYYSGDSEADKRPFMLIRFGDPAHY